MNNEDLLIKKASDGDVEAFEELICMYQKKIFNLAYRMLEDYHDASEITQEIFIKIYKNIGNFRNDSKFSTWIYRIASNTCLDELRKRKNKKIVYLDEETESNDTKIKKQLDIDQNTPEMELERRELRESIKDSLSSLPEKIKLAVVLRDIQGFSYEDISKYLSCSVGTVKSRINRGRQRLKEIFKNKELNSTKFVYTSEGRENNEKV